MIQENNIEKELSINIRNFMNDKIEIVEGDRFSNLDNTPYINFTEFYLSYMTFCKLKKIKIQPKHLFFNIYYKTFSNLDSKRLIDRRNGERTPILVGVKMK